MLLYDWIDSQKKTLNIRLSFSDYNIKGIEYWDYLVTGEVEGQTIRGRGQSTSQISAFIKACNEFIERLILKNSDLTSSNGLAVHIDQNIAYENAKSEAIERDLFLCHYLTNSPWRTITPEFDSAYKKILDEIHGDGKNIYFGQLSDNKNYFTTCCVITGENYTPQFGYSIGISTKPTLLNSCKKSFQEAFMNSFQFDDFDPEVSSPAFHLKHSLQHDQEKAIKNFFGDTKLILDGNLEEPKQIIKIKAPQILDNLDIHIYKASTDNLQNLFFGETTLEKINMDRLSRFLNKKLDPNLINTNLHPIP